MFDQELDDLEVTLPGSQVERCPAHGVGLVEIGPAPDQVFRDGELTSTRGPIERGVALCGIGLVVRGPRFQGIDEMVMLVEDRPEVIEAPLACEVMDGRGERRLIGIVTLDRQASGHD
jgi:hypothetical protein